MFSLLNLIKIKKQTSNHRANGIPIVIVSGIPRSGTSMMMRMLASAQCDILTDNIRQPDQSNPNGYFEFEQVKQLKNGNIEWLPQARGKVVKIISALLQYLPSEYPYRLIFMQREMDEVVASQRTMLEDDHKASGVINDGQMAVFFQNHLEKVTKWINEQPNVSAIFINYNTLLQEPYQQLNQLNDFLGGNLDIERMAQVIDRRLYRQRINFATTLSERK